MTNEPTITRNTSAGDTEQGPRRPESEVSKRTFVGTLSAALTVLMLLLFATVSMNAVTAAFSPGIGGINATFNQLTYNDTTAGAGHADAHIYPTTTPDTAACAGVNDGAGAVPVLTADVPGTVEVQGLFLKKTINVTQSAPFAVMTGIDNITLNITAAQDSSIELTDPTLEFSGLDARWLNLSGGVAIYENHSNGTTSAPYLGPDGEFHVNATNLTMVSATAWAHLVAFEQIQLPNQSLSLDFNEPGAIANDTCDLS